MVNKILEIKYLMTRYSTQFAIGMIVLELLYQFLPAFRDSLNGTLYSVISISSWIVLLLLRSIKQADIPVEKDS